MRGHLGASSIFFLVVAACGPGPRHGDDDSNGGDDSSGVDARTPVIDASGQYAEAAVFAHTSSTLYRVDPETLAVTLVGDFVWSSGSDEMTDIAIDQDGVMIGISFTSVYRVDPMTAHATLLSSGLDGDFNGLSFVPGDQLGNPEAADVLVATRDVDGRVFRVDPMTGHTTPIGDMGPGFSSSGDVVSVSGWGTAATANGFPQDRLVRLTPVTFSAQAIGGATGYGDIWGVGFWKDRVYGFTETGSFVLIDPATGVASLVGSSGQRWWGAAVTTRAPVIE